MAWVLVAATALWFGRETPAPPVEDEEAVAVAERKAAWIRRDVEAWRATHGDRSLPWAKAHGHLAIVIDDVGRELHAHAELQALRYPLTFSILPGSEFAAGAQLRLREDPRRYREIWLHMPMEPLDAAQMQRGDEAKESFMRVDDGPALWRAKLEAAYARVPAAIGVNNHMGSRLSADPAAMDVVAAWVAERELLFLDSRTTAESVAADAARRAGVLSGERQVFLDHDPDPAAMRASLREAIARAKSEPIVAIGHPSPQLAAVLEEGLEEAYAEGVGVYPLSEILAHRAESAQVARRSEVAARVLTP